MRVQAAYDRQRDLKATYQMVANAVKPALEHLCTRQVDELLDNYDPNNPPPVMVRIAAELQQRFDTVITEHDAALYYKQHSAEKCHKAETEIAHRAFDVCSPVCPYLSSRPLTTAYRTMSRTSSTNTMTELWRESAFLLACMTRIFPLM